MPAKEAWGLDIGQCAIRLVKVHRSRSELTISDYAVEPIDTYPDDPDYEEKVQDKLAEVVDEYRIGKSPVVVSLSGFSTLFRDFPLPTISASKLDEIVSYEAKQQIPYPLEEVLWDYHQYQAEEDSPELNIALVCCRRDIVENLLINLEDVDLNITAIQVGPVGLANFLLYDQPPENVNLVLDCGARATEFLIINNNSFWQRSISVAGNDVSKALMKKFNLPYNDAEDLKKKMGESKQADRVFQVIKPVLRTLSGEIQRSMGYYKSLYRGVNVEGVVAAGGSFKVPGVDQFSANEIGLPVSRLSSLEYIELDDDIDEEDFNSNIEYLGTAIGLAIQGVGEAEIGINLLPPEIQKKHIIRAKLPFAIAATLLIVAATVVSMIFAMERATRWEDLNEKLEKVLSSKGTIGAAERKLKKAVEKFGPAEEKNMALGKVAVNRGDMREALSTILSKITEINNKRGEEVEASDEINVYADKFNQEVLDPLTGDQKVREFLDKISNEEEREKLYERIKKASRIKAKRITDRRRKVFVENIVIDSIEELWYREQLDGDKLGPILTQTEFDEMIEKLRNERDGEDKVNDKMKKITTKSIFLCVVKMSGFSVNESIEIKDVMKLKNIFNKLPEVIDISFERDTQRIVNNLPVIQPKYVDDAAAVSGSTDSMSKSDDNIKDKIEWTVFEEPIQAFNMTMKYLPSRRLKEVMEMRGELADKSIRSSAAEVKPVEGKKTSPGERGSRRRRR
ncbi:MAG: type IV pilus assembly protein PilM [Planctomycetota bacterium]|jgi:type IV pilus assembly protein PilM